MIRRTFGPRSNSLGQVIDLYNANNDHHQATFDELGRVIQRVDFVGGTESRTSYDYGPFGVLRESNPPASTSSSTTLTMQYDVLGRRIELFDPDAGHVSRVYNAFGEVVEEIDGNRQSTTYDFDALGRVTESSSVRDGVNTFTWDTSPQGIGK